MSSENIRLIGSLYMSLGRMTEILDRMERHLSASKPQPPRPGNRPADLRPLTSDLRSGARS